MFRRKIVILRINEDHQLLHITLPRGVSVSVQRKQVLPERDYAVGPGLFSLMEPEGQPDILIQEA